MFCPLCKAEYRQGFSTCSDCHIALVTTREEAEAIFVDSLWKGDDRKKCTRILDKLTDLNIPFRSKESVKSEIWPWLSILLFRFMTPRPTFEFEVWVFHKDLEQAENAVREKEDPEYD